jgi:hypothetical protein
LRLGEAVSRGEPVAKDFAEAAVSIADLDGDVTRKRMPDDTDLATGADGPLGGGSGVKFSTFGGSSVVGAS